MRDWLRLKRFIPVTALFVACIGLSYRALSSQAPADPAATAVLRGDAAHPAQAQGWVDTKLYFGLGPADVPDKGVSEAAWRDFLDAEVTPRFPAGLSVVDVYGQWQGKTGPNMSGPNMTTNDGKKHPSRIRSKMLVIDYPGTAENEAKVESIRVAWKQRTHDQSVLKVTQAADVSF